MGIADATIWGLAGGVAAGLVALSASVVVAGYRWPWKGNPDGLGPRLFVTTTGILLGALVAAAAHSQMNGAWPAFLMGVAAPSVVRGAIARTEVEEIEARPPGSALLTPTSARPSHPPPLVRRKKVASKEGTP
jgi:uncharacterized membrane protein YfcA